jgi:hypothetical protein
MTVLAPVDKGPRFSGRRLIDGQNQGMTVSVETRMERMTMADVSQGAATRLRSVSQQKLITSLLQQRQRMCRMEQPFFAKLPAGDAEAYVPVFQRIPEPACIAARSPEQNQLLNEDQTGPGSTPSNDGIKHLARLSDETHPLPILQDLSGVILLQVMLRIRFPLSLRNAEDRLHERSSEVSHETGRFWWGRTVAMFAAGIRRSRAGQMRTWRMCWWHLDEV